MGTDPTTVDSFPTYADLTQTQGWATLAASPVVGALDDTTEVALTGPDRYTEGALLGVGGMGKVMLARDARIGREVAIKQLHAERELSADERARFLREARVQGQLEHPSIVPVYDIDRRPDGTTFFTMRRVLGRTLLAILEELRAGVAAARTRYTQRELLTAFATVCLTIDYAHSRGVVHRDLKPANIMLGDFGEVYVLDWGLARLVEDGELAPVDEPAVRLSMTGEMMGTPLYMAPEQMADPTVGCGADVFSLGAILFELLTLERLRDASTLYLPAEARPSIRAPERGIALELEAICVRATESDPAERHGSARALQEAVVRYLEGDREVVQRRALATEHDRAARAALARADQPGADADAERGTAIRELGRALALDPTDAERVATLGRVFAATPRVVPVAVASEERTAEQTLVRVGARHSIAASLMWFAFLPLVVAMGILPGHAYEATLVLAPTAIAALLSALALRRAVIPDWMQVGVVGFTLLGAASTSRMYGPLVMLPTLVATFCIVLQAHPQRLLRNLTWGMGIVAIAAPMLLELAGVLPPSYLFEDGRIVIVPQMHALPRTESIALLLSTSIAMTIVPCVFIGRLRVALTQAQRQLLLQAWNFRQLGGQLVDAAPPR